MKNTKKMDKYVQYGLAGTPELRKSEKEVFLGEFEERVVLAIDSSQVLNEEKNKQFKEKAKTGIVDKIIVNEHLNSKTRIEYMKVAKELKKDFKLVQSKSKISIVLATNQANEIEDIFL